MAVIVIPDAPAAVNRGGGGVAINASLRDLAFGFSVHARDETGAVPRAPEADR